jgi:creatinine amidohydrolase
LNLHELSWVGAKKYFRSNDIVLFPVGSTEQHGPQNPLGTDHLIARCLAEEAAERTAVACLPTVPFGVSSHHWQFWGTVHVKPETFKAYMHDICVSLKYYGVRKIVVVNGHGGNTPALAGLAREFRERNDLFMSVFIWWEVARKCLSELFSEEEVGHAAAEETSVNLVLHPRLVDMNKAVDEKPSRPFFDASSFGVNYRLDTADYTGSGVFGTSTTASVKKGKMVFEVVVEELVKHVEAVKKSRIDDLLPNHLCDADA